jgi:hypothetical protein
MGEMRKGVDEFKDTFDVDRHVKEIETLKNEFIEAVEATDAQEVEVVKTRPPDRRAELGAVERDDGDYPEVSQDGDDD